MLPWSPSPFLLFFSRALRFCFFVSSMASPFLLLRLFFFTPSVFSYREREFEALSFRPSLTGRLLFIFSSFSSGFLFLLVFSCWDLSEREGRGWEQSRHVNFIQLIRQFTKLKTTGLPFQRLRSCKCIPILYLFTFLVVSILRVGLGTREKFLSCNFEVMGVVVELWVGLWIKMLVFWIVNHKIQYTFYIITRKYTCQNNTMLKISRIIMLRCIKKCYKFIDIYQIQITKLFKYIQSCN